MKYIRINIIIIISLLLLINTLSLSHKKHLKSVLMQNNTMSDNNIKNTENSNVTIESNAVGRQGKNLFIELGKNITSCEQILKFEAQSIDVNDFTIKEKAEYILNEYFLNEFRNSILNKSIVLSDIQDLPMELNGAPGCLIFISKLGEQMGICLEDNEKILSLIDNYKLYLKCRNGEGLNYNNKYNVINGTECFGLQINQPSNMTMEEFQKAYDSSLIQTAQELDNLHKDDNK